MPFADWNPEQAQAIIAVHQDREGALLPLLHALNGAFGHVPADAVPMVAQALNLSRADVHGLITFYHDFRDTPPTAHVLKLCRAEACQARGGEGLATRTLAAFADRKDISVEAVYCLGLCANGPAALIDGRPVARLDDARLAAILAEIVG